MPKRRTKGEGSVYKDGRGLWRGAVTMPDGRRRYISGKTRQEAAAKVQELAVAGRRGLAPQDGAQPLAAYLAAWLESRRLQVRPSTFASQESIIRTRIAPELGRLRLVDLTARHVGAMLARLQARGLAASSIALTRGVLRHALADAVRDGALARNVADHVRPPRQERPNRAWLDAEAARRYLAAAAENPDGAILAATLLLGLRPGEARGLRWDDYSQARGQLAIRRTATRRRGQWVETPPKTAAGRRVLAVLPPLAELLATERQRQQAAGWYTAAGPLFLAHDGARYTEDRMDLAHAKTLAAAGLPSMRVHDLRHSAASILLERGIHIRTVAELLGHSSPTVTLATYSHVSARQVDSAAAALAGLLPPYAAQDAAQPDPAEPEHPAES